MMLLASRISISALAKIVIASQQEKMAKEIFVYKEHTMSLSRTRVNKGVNKPIKEVMNR